MKRMIAMTVSPGAATAAIRLISPLLTALTTEPPAPAHHEQERAEQLGEEAPPLQARIVHIGPRRVLHREQRVTPAPGLGLPSRRRLGWLHSAHSPVSATIRPDPTASRTAA